MRSLYLTFILTVGMASGLLTTRCQGQATVTVGWTLSTSSNVAGYDLAYGTNSGIYFATNYYAGPQTNGVVTNLQYGINYYFVVAAVSTKGIVSPFSNEVTNNVPEPPSQTPPTSGAPPPPGGKTGGKNAPNTGQVATSQTANNGTSGSSGGGGGGAGAITQAQLWGVPPIINLTVSNGQPTMAIAGTVGATVNVQSTTNPAAPFSWRTITNVALTNIAPIANDTIPGQPKDAIDLAYVPAFQAAALPTTVSVGKMQFFRVVMPYDYVILASQTLPPQGYSARLIVVNMTGLNDDACYVAQAGSFIHFTRTNSSFQLASSGSTIRQIATTLANNLNLDWTTASEFLYTNGVGQILATVVEADPPSSDPVAGQSPPTSSILINF